MQSQELMVNQDAFKVGRPSPVFQSLRPEDDTLGAGIGAGYAVLSYKGKVWSLVHRGDKHTFIRPDDGTPLPYLDVIILGYAQGISKSYYRKYDPNQSQGERPICASINGIVPDPGVEQPQAQACKLCPRNVFKTDQTGRKFRECSDYKRLAVLVLPNLTKEFYNGVPLVEPVFLRVPPASLGNLGALHEQMAKQQGYHHATYVTRITFDPNEPHPKMVFRALQPVPDAQANFILEIIKNPTVKRITEGDVVLPDRTLAAPADQPVATGLEAAMLATSAAATPATAAIVASHTATENVKQVIANSQPLSEQAQVDAADRFPTTVGAVAPAPVTTTVAPPTEDPFAGFGAAGVPLSTEAATVVNAAPAAAPGSAGVAEESDADLDARIAGALANAK